MEDTKSTECPAGSTAESGPVSSVSVIFEGSVSAATLTPLSGANEVELETIELSDISDGQDPDESCVIVEPPDDVGERDDSSRAPCSKDSSRGFVDQNPSMLVALDSPEKNSDAESSLDRPPPRKRRALQLAMVAAAVGDALEAGEVTRTGPSTSSPVPYNIFSSLLNSSRANSATPPATPIPSVPSAVAPSATHAAFSDGVSLPTANPGASLSTAAVGSAAIVTDAIAVFCSSSSSSRSASPRAKADSSSSYCHLPFCEIKCDVETHHPLLRALSSCIGSLSSSSINSGEYSAHESAALSSFESVVIEWEGKSADGWNRTREIKEMAKMKEYYYPLLHTAAVSGCVGLVRWMLTKGFGDFSQPICSPLMQCLLNIDCAVRKIHDRIKIFKEMMELMPSELTRAILDSADRPTSILICACSKASRDTSDKSFFLACLKKIFDYLMEKYDAETQKLVLQLRNSEGNTCVHELSRLDDCLPVLRKMYELCKKLGIVENVFRSTNLRGKSALDMAADAGAIRLVTFLSPIVPASNNAPPPVRTPGDGGRDKGTAPKTTVPAADVVPEPIGDEMERNESSACADKKDVVEAMDGVPTSRSGSVSRNSEGTPVDGNHEEESTLVQLPMPVEEEEENGPGVEIEGERRSSREFFRPLFREDLKTDAKLKIVERHLAEKRKLAADIQARMEKHGKNVDEIKSKISETEEDTRKKIENMKVIYELLLRTQQSIGVNDARVKELNAQLVGERKTIAAHEKVSQELSDVVAIMDQLHSTLTNQVALNASK